MTKAILTTKIDPTYDDLPEQQYHFPRSYLRQVEAAKGDWIVYYELRRSSGNLSSRGGRQAYFATARVTEIVADPPLADHFYAYIADYLDFDQPSRFARDLTITNLRCGAMTARRVKVRSGGAVARRLRIRRNPACRLRPCSRRDHCAG